MPEFVSRSERRESRSFDGEMVYLDDANKSDSYGPVYDYKRVAKVNENFPVFDYTGSGVVAFMDPDNMEISMPTWERMPYGAKDHVLFHETLHIYTELGHGHHDERGFNDMAVDALRGKSGYNFFPFPSY